MRSKIQTKLFWFHTRASKVHFRSTEGQTFYWPIMTADDRIKCRCVNSGMTGQVGGFQNPGVCLQAFPSFLPHPLPALLLAPFFARSLTLDPPSLLLNRTETLATQAKEKKSEIFLKKESNRMQRWNIVALEGGIHISLNRLNRRRDMCICFFFLPTLKEISSISDII